MGVVSTEAIVLSSIKYGDTSLIVRCFTKEEGLKTYIIKGVLSKKKAKIKPAYFQPLTQLTIEANHNNKGNLNTLKEVHVKNPYTSIYATVFKQTIVMFLSEILNSSVQEEEENKPLYDYLESALFWLDMNDDVSNFHLLFLLNLTKFLGCYPDTTDRGKEGFNLIEGKFVWPSPEKEVLSGGDVVQFKKLLGISFDTINSVSFSKKERQQVLRIIIRYFNLHLEGFKQPKSLDVLETVFS